MTVSAIDSALLGTTQATTSTSSTTNAMDAEDFLTLFLVQLENQDPTDPVDTTELTSQLCNISQLSQSVIANDYLEDLTLYHSSVNNSLALSCIGKTVTTDGDSISLAGGAADEIRFELSDDADQAYVTVYNADGEEVATIDCGALSAGTNSVTWNGLGGDGDTQPDGTYGFEVNAYDSDGNSVEASTMGTANITGVTYRDGVAYLITESGEEIPIGDVTGVSMT